MSAQVQYLDTSDTPLGPISLRRRREPSLDVDVYEVKLGEEYLMSSLFTASEAELARLALTLTSSDSTGLDVLVGGLGLGCTARAALSDPRVRSVHVVEALQPVIDWHHRELVPHARDLTGDPRCHLVHGDFFQLVAAEPPIAPGAPHRYDAVLLDIDHTPDHHLHPRHAAFYTPAGLRGLTRHLRPDGVFALWSDQPPDPDHLAMLRGTFTTAEARAVTFPNPHTGGASSSTIYLAEGPLPSPAP
jgi:spermidine synthase